MRMKDNEKISILFTKDSTLILLSAPLLTPLGQQRQKFALQFSLFNCIFGNFAQMDFKTLKWLFRIYFKSM